MLFADKNYYYLQEVIDRWGVTIRDIRYFAEHGELEILTWIPDTLVRIYKSKRTEDGEVVFLKPTPTSHKGYLVVDTDDLRRIFQCAPQPVARFKSINSGDLYEIFDTTHPPVISVDDLVVCRLERERFEAKFALPRVNTEDDFVPSPKQYVSFSGRPSVMHKIEQEMQHRASCALMLPTLAAEARALHDWAKANILTEQIPTARTISNALRTTYKFLTKPSEPSVPSPKEMTTLA